MDKDERKKLIGKYADGAGRLREALAAAPESMRKWRPEPSEFSVHEIILHCADSETNSHGRIRYLMAGNNDAVILGYDPDVWAQTFGYAQLPIDAAMLTVEAVRANTVPLLRHVPESAWAKSGTHSESGAYTAEDWLRIYADHCHDHADQIDRTVAAWKASGSA